MKRLIIFLIASAALGASAGSHAEDGVQHGLTREQVRQEITQAYLNGTLPQDEKETYPGPSLYRDNLAAIRKEQAARHLERFRSSENASRVGL